MHTSAPCRLNINPTGQSGTDVQTDCSLTTNYMDGCGVSGPSNSYGDSFNSQGGGVWALSLDHDTLMIWMFPRNAVPADIAKGTNLTPKSWGIPLLNFTSHIGCRVGEQWKNQTIVSIHSSLSIL